MTERWERWIGKYGAATAIALFLVWWMASDVSGNLKTQGEQIQRLQTTLDAHGAEQRFFLRAICLNTAQSESQRAACIPSGDAR